MYSVRNEDFADVLKLVLEMTPPAGDPAAAGDPTAAGGTAAAAPADEMKNKHTTVLVSELRRSLSMALATYTTEKGKLDERMSKVMQSLATSAGTDASSVTQLTQRVEQLTQDYQTKSREVDSVLQNIEDLLPNLASMPAASTRLEKIRGALTGMKDELRTKGEEAARLLQTLTAERGHAKTNMASLQRDLVALDDYANEVEELLTKAKADIERLENHLSSGKRMKVPASALQADSTKHYGALNLQEHLDRAAKKQGVKRSWF